MRQMRQIFQTEKIIEKACIKAAPPPLRRRHQKRSAQAVAKHRITFLRRRKDSNLRRGFPLNTLAVCCIRPLCHASLTFANESRERARTSSGRRLSPAAQRHRLEKRMKSNAGCFSLHTPPLNPSNNLGQVPIGPTLSKNTGRYNAPIVLHPACNLLQIDLDAIARTRIMA
jgi:hypothetical protein